MHNHAHSHSHGPHDHGHNHGMSSGGDVGFAFAVGTLLNTIFIAIEVAAGIIGNSTALLADAGHNISDVLGLVVAWGAAWLVRKPPQGRFTYGFGNSSILAAQFNSLLLLVAVGAIMYEAIERLGAPKPVATTTVMTVAAIGIAVNGLTAWLFARGRHHDLNVRGAFLHMTADAAVSAGVVVSSAVIAFTGASWIDPLVGIVIAAVILWSTWGLFRESVRMSLAAVPPNVDVGAVRRYLSGLSGVQDVHDLHIWPLSTTEVALTCHLLMPNGHPGDRFLMDVCHELLEHYGIGHSTLQIEIDSTTACKLAPEHVV